MATAFVDAGAWIALLVERDANHARAVAFYRDLGRGDLVTSNLTLAESYTRLFYHRYRFAALELRKRILAAQQLGMLKVVWVTPDIEARAWEILERYGDQVLSYADATSAVIANDQGVDGIFGFDSDFQVLGFQLLPG